MPARSLLLGNPIVNSYCLFTVIMVAFYVRTTNVFGAQGRHWLPFRLPAFLAGLEAPMTTTGLLALRGFGLCKRRDSELVATDSVRHTGP
jgi:hypothetical protein